MSIGVVVAAVCLVLAGWCLRIDGASRLVRLDEPVVSREQASANDERRLGTRLRILGCVVAGLVILSVVPSVLGVGLAVVVVPLAYLLLGKVESGEYRQRRELLATQQPEILDLLAASLQAGSALRNATQEVARVAPEPSAGLLHQVDAHLQIGFQEAQAWESLRDDEIWGPASRDIARGAKTGEAMAETLLTHAELSRNARKNALTTKAKKVGVKSVGPMTCCFLPAFLMVGVVPMISSLFAEQFSGLMP